MVTLPPPPLLPQDFNDDDLDAEIENMISNHEAESQAALRIQASFRGFQGRKRAREQAGAQSVLKAERAKAEEYKRLYLESQQAGTDDEEDDEDEDSLLVLGAEHQGTPKSLCVGLLICRLLFQLSSSSGMHISILSLVAFK